MYRYIHRERERRDIEGAVKEMESFIRFLRSAKPYFGVIFVQFGYAGMAILTKSALDKGMSQHVFVAYRQVAATLVIAPFAIIFERSSFLIHSFVLFCFYCLDYLLRTDIWIDFLAKKSVLKIF